MNFYTSHVIQTHTLLLLGFGLLSLPANAQTQQGTKDCSVIQNKIDAAAKQGGGKVVIEAGNYLCKEPIIIQSDNIELVGQTSSTPPNSGTKDIGAFNLVNIKIADARNIPAIVIGSIDTKWDPVKKDFFTPKTVRNVSVKNLTIDGNKDKQSQECWEGQLHGGCQGEVKAAIRNNGLTIRGAEDVSVSEVVLNNNRSGGMVTEKHCKNLKVSRMKASDNFFDGFAGYQTEGSTIADSELTKNHGAGASLDINFSKNKFQNVTFANNAHQGVFARSLDHLTFENSRIQDNGFQGLFFAPSESGPCPTHMVLRDTIISGSGRNNANLGQGLRLASEGCTDNCLDHVQFSNNVGGDLSWVGHGPNDIADPKKIACREVPEPVPSSHSTQE